MEETNLEPTCGSPIVSVKPASLDSPIESARSSSGESDQSPGLLSNFVELAKEEIIPLEDEVFDFEMDSPFGKKDRSSSSDEDRPSNKASSKIGMSPLTASEVVELFKEAQTVAISLQHASGNARKRSSAASSDDPYESKEEDSVTQEESSPLVLLKVPARFADKPAIQLQAPSPANTGKSKLALTPRQNTSVSRIGSRATPGKENPTGLKRSSSFRSSGPALFSRGTEGRRSLKRASSFNSQQDAKRPALAKEPVIKKPMAMAEKPVSKLAALPSKPRLQTLRPPGSETSAPASKLQLKAPPMKQTLLQKPTTGMPQPKSLLGKSLRLKAPSFQRSAGPLKAVNTQKTSTEATTPAKGPSAMKANPTRKLVPPSASSHLHTPVKSESKAQPKRLAQMTTEEPKTPEPAMKKADTCSTPASVKSIKRRSFLPTPNRTGSTASSSSRPSCSSVSSYDSNCSSPALRGRSPMTRPALGVLVDINGVNDSPSCFKPRKSRVQHTPLNGESKEPKRSLWSPIRKKKLTLDDEIHHCTKKQTSKS